MYKYKAEDLIRQYEVLKSERMPYERTFDDITDLVVRNRSRFTEDSIEYDPELEVYDSTASQSAEYLVATLLNGLVNPQTKWFNLQFKNRELNEDFAASLELSARTKIMYDVFNSSSTGFFNNLAEMLLDTAAYGTGVMECFFEPAEGIKFRSIHLAQIYIATDKSGKVDTVYRKFRFTARQAAQMWGYDKLPTKMLQALEDEPHKKFEIVRCVKPQEDYEIKERTKQRFYSGYICVESKEIISEGGLKFFPYVVPRWTKPAGEDYGRSPAWIALPEIMLLQGMQEARMDAAQKVADPTMLVADESALSGVTADAGSMVYGGIDPISGNVRMAPLQTGIDLRAFDTAIEEKQRSIRLAFYNNALSMQNTARMTAEEVITRREEDFRLLGPNANRIIQEAIEPIVWLTFALMQENGYFPPRQAVPKGEQLKLRMMGPLANTAKMQEAGAFTRFVNQLVVPLAQMDPTVMDKISVDRSFDVNADNLGVPLEMLSTPQEYAQKQIERQQQLDMQMQMQMAAQADQAETARMQAENQGAQPSGTETEI